MKTFALIPRVPQADLEKSSARFKLDGWVSSGYLFSQFNDTTTGGENTEEFDPSPVIQISDDQAFQYPTRNVQQLVRSAMSSGKYPVILPSIPSLLVSAQKEQDKQTFKVAGSISRSARLLAVQKEYSGQQSFIQFPAPEVSMGVPGSLSWINMVVKPAGHMDFEFRVLDQFGVFRSVVLTTRCKEPRFSSDAQNIPQPLSIYSNSWQYASIDLAEAVRLSFDIPDNTPVVPREQSSSILRGQVDGKTSLAQPPSVSRPSTAALDIKCVPCTLESIETVYIRGEGSVARLFLTSENAKYDMLPEALKIKVV